MIAIVFLATLAPVALFYVRGSLFLTFVGFPLVCIACAIKAFRSDVMVERVVVLAIPFTFLFVLGCLLLFAPQSGLQKRVGPLSFDRTPIRTFMRKIEDISGYPTAAVNPATYTFLTDNELTSAPPVTLNCSQMTLRNLLKEIEHQTCLNIVVRGASPFEVSLSGHYQTLDISIYIPCHFSTNDKKRETGTRQQIMRDE